MKEPIRGDRFRRFWQLGVGASGAAFGFEAFGRCFVGACPDSATNSVRFVPRRKGERSFGAGFAWVWGHIAASAVRRRLFGLLRQDRVGRRSIPGGWAGRRRTDRPEEAGKGARVTRRREARQTAQTHSRQGPRHEGRLAPGRDAVLARAEKPGAPPVGSGIPACRCVRSGAGRGPLPPVRGNGILPPKAIRAGAAPTALQARPRWRPAGTAWPEARNGPKRR